MSTEGTFERIITNPPYFEHGRTSPDEGRKQARHTGDLSFEALLDQVAALLDPQGLFQVVLPAAEYRNFLHLARWRGLFCSHCCWVRSRANSEPVRVLLAFQKAMTPMVTEELVIYEGAHYSRQFRKWTEGLYPEGFLG